jgi:prophage DNA circulation protein
MVLGNCNVVNILGATQSGLVADNSNDKANQKVEGRKSFDPAGNRVLTITPVDVMSLQDLENMLYALNNYVQRIVVLNRANGQDVQYLLNMTNQTISYVDKEKLNRKAFVNVNTNNIPLHLLVTSLGLDYNAVDRVLKLNPQIKNPTFSFGNLKVYAE